VLDADIAYPIRHYSKTLEVASPILAAIGCGQCFIEDGVSAVFVRRERRDP
jgi:hypothetical protein